MKIISYIILFTAPHFTGVGQTPTFHLDSLPYNEGSLRAGILENGFTYFIKSTYDPQEKVRMNFIVKVGSYHEEPYEQNFAHHIEHLAFRQTENFPSGIQSDSNLLNDLDMGFRDLIGYTNALETQYFFNAPSNNIAIENGLMWFKDIASGLDLSPANINRERGVLLQESQNDGHSKTNESARDFLFSQLLPCWSDTRRRKEHIMQFPHYDLQKFHQKWYRPDLMGVSIIGKIDNIDKLEENVREIFSEIEPISQTTPVPKCIAAFDENSTYLSEQPRYAIVNTQFDSLSDHGGNRIIYHLIFKDRSVSKNSGNFEFYKNQQTASFVSRILNKRFMESLNEYGITFDFYGSYKSKIFPNALHVTVSSKLEDEEEAMTRAMATVNQLWTHGITTKELERIKNEELERLKSIDTSGAHYWQREVQNHFIYNYWLSSSKLTKEIEWIKNLSVQEVNDKLHRMIYGPPEDIGVITPVFYSGNLISENNIRKFIQQIFDKDPEPYDPDFSELVFMDKEELDALQKKPVLGLRSDFKDTMKIQLANGLTVILKPNTTGQEKTKQIFLHGFTSTGASSFPEKDYYSAMFAPFIVRHSGIGHLDKFALDELYKIKSLPSQIIPYLHLNESGIKVRGSSDEFETLLQVIYLYFTQARKDKSAFEDWKQGLERHPVEKASRDRIDALNAVTGNFTELPIGSKRRSASQTVELERSYMIYNHIFGKPQNFTFILTGDFINEEAIPLLQKYLGNIPQNSLQGPEHKSTSSKSSLHPGFHEFYIPDSYESNIYSYGGKFIRGKIESDNWKEEFKVKALGYVLGQLLYNLRSNKGYPIYSFGAQGEYNDVLNRYEISLYVKSAPEDFGRIKKEIYNLLDDIKMGKISSDIITTGLNNLEKTFNEVYLENHRNMNKSLYRFYKLGEPIVPTKMILHFIDSLTPDDIIKTAQKHLQKDTFYEVLMK